MKKILVPIDFSETSENAFVYALEMAKVYRSELVLLHTYELPIVDNQVVAVNYTEIFDTLELANSNHFSDEISKLMDIANKYAAGHIELNHIMMNGDLIDCIQEVVRQENVDFVVMGTNGSSGWLDSFIGSNTSSVISDVSVPVLSVALETKFTQIKTIGFRTRYKEDEIYALNEVLSMARRIGAKVKCVYVKTPDSGFKGGDIQYWETIFENERDLEFFVLPSDDIESTIEEFIENQNIDLLSMVNHRKNFFARLFTTSTTQKMSQHSKTPILALHD